MKKLLIVALLTMSGTGLLHGMDNTVVSEIDNSNGIAEKNNENTTQISNLQSNIINCLNKSLNEHGKSDRAIFSHFYYAGYRQCPIKWDNTPLKKLDSEFLNLMRLEKKDKKAYNIALNEYDFDMSLIQAISDKEWEKDNDTIIILQYIRNFLNNYPRYKEFLSQRI